MMKTPSTLRATAMISVAIVLALLTVQGTLALWNATTSSEGQTVETAAFNVVVTAGGKTQTLADGATLTVAGPSGLTPGASGTMPILVTNATEAGGAFTIRATATARATGDLAPHLATGIGVGQDDRCIDVPPATSVVLAKDASAVFCLTTTLDRNTPGTFAGSAASIAVTLTTEQQPR